MAWYKCSGGGEGIPLITKSGSIVTYEDSVGGVPVNDLVADITPIQASGTPTPTNPLPISGYTSGAISNIKKNIFNPQYLSATGITVSGTEVSGTASSLNVAFNQSAGGINMNLPTDRLTLSFSAYTEQNSSSTGDGIRFVFVHNDDSARQIVCPNATSSYTDFTLTSYENKPVKMIYITFGSSGGNIWHLKNIQLEIGSTSTTFEPYNGQTETRSFGQTVYGGKWKASQGKVRNDYDFLEFSEVASVATSGTGVVYWVMRTGLSSVNGGVMSDYFKKSPTVEAGNSYVTGTGNILVACPTDQTLNTKALADAWCATNKPHFLIPLATPTEISVEPVSMETIEGENKVFANTGDINVKFYKSSVSNLDTLVEQTKDLAPDLLKMVSGGNGSTTRVGVDLTDDTIGTKATRIPDYMFYKNLNVEIINLSTVESVGSNTFYMCPYLKEINLPNATELKSSAFNASSRSLTLPTPMVINLPSVITLNDSALREMGYAGTPCTITLTACETVSANSVRGASGRYFVIDTLDLPAVKTIGQESFNYHQFTNVIIGTACTSIASKPFNYCTITNLTVKATTPPTLNANGLGCTPTHIYVPTDSVATYKAASNWSTYASIIEAIPT